MANPISFIFPLLYDNLPYNPFYQVSRSHAFFRQIRGTGQKAMRSLCAGF